MNKKDIVWLARLIRYGYQIRNAHEREAWAFRQLILYLSYNVKNFDPDKFMEECDVPQ